MPSKDNMSLGDRMKIYYENCSKIVLPRRMPLIIRLDGKAFHTLTRGCEKPFDMNIIKLMDQTTKYLCKNIQGAVLAYVQSDEISILVHNYKRLTSSAWFDNELEKIVSITAGMASAYFTMMYNESVIAYRNHRDILKPCIFDSRVFVLLKQKYVIILFGDNRTGKETVFRCLLNHYIPIKNFRIKIVLIFRRCVSRKERIGMIYQYL